MNIIRLLSLLVGGSLAAFAQSAPATVIPQDGLSAMHCIKSGDRDWLSSPLSEAQTLRFGFTLDRQSHPGQSHLIVVVYENRSNGQVFDVLEGRAKDQLRLTVVNNGVFHVAGGKVDLDELLWGVWTYQYIQRNVRSIIRQQSFSVSVSKLRQPLKGVVCSSYVEETSRPGR